MKQIAIAVFCALVLPAQAQFTYTTNSDGTLAITGFSGAGSMTVPGTINGRSVRRIEHDALRNGGFTNVSIANGVTSIGARALGACSKLAHLELPETLISIEEGAFASCTALSELRIPNSVVNIDDGAFSHCGKMTNLSLGYRVQSIGSLTFASCPRLVSVRIPYRVTSIQSGAFIGCDHLAAFEVDDLNFTYSSEDGVLFNKAKTVLIRFPEGKGGAYKPPSSVTEIEVSAFSSCTLLKGIEIPQGVTRIGIFAFTGCTGLRDIVLPDALNNIEWSAFSRCRGLTNVTIPEGVTNISESAFSECDNLATVHIPSSVVSIEEDAFGACGSQADQPGLYFEGNAPTLGLWALYSGDLTAYYLPGTSGWGPTFGEQPAVLWNPQMTNASPTFGALSNQFGFNITTSSPLRLAVEACTNVSNPEWRRIEVKHLSSSRADFIDDNWSNYPNRFYRLRMP